MNKRDRVRVVKILIDPPDKKYDVYLGKIGTIVGMWIDRKKMIVRLDGDDHNHGFSPNELEVIE